MIPTTAFAYLFTLGGALMVPPTLLFHARRKYHPLAGREPALVTLTNGTLIGLLIFTAVTYFLNSLPCIVGQVTSALLLPAMLVSIALRTGSLLFRFEITRDMKSIEQNSLEQWRPNWYSRHRAWVRPERLIRTGLVFWLIIGVVFAVVSISHGAFSNSMCSQLSRSGSYEADVLYIALLYVAIFVVVMALMGWKLKKHDSDNFGMRTELKAMIGSLAIAAILYLAVLLGMPKSPMRQLISNLIFVVGLLACVFTPLTVWPLYLSYRFQRQQREMAARLSHITRLTELLAMPGGFEVFAEFSATEFSSELPSFWRRVTTYKQMCTANKLRATSDVSPTARLTSETMPRAIESIIYDMLTIYDTFIARDSPMEVNISAGMRQDCLKAIRGAGELCGVNLVPSSPAGSRTGGPSSSTNSGLAPGLGPRSGTSRRGFHSMVMSPATTKALVGSCPSPYSVTGATLDPGFRSPLPPPPPPPTAPPPPVPTSMARRGGASSPRSYSIPNGSRAAAHAAALSASPPPPPPPLDTEIDITMDDEIPPPPRSMSPRSMSYSGPRLPTASTPLPLSKTHPSTVPTGSTSTDATDATALRDDRSGSSSRRGTGATTADPSDFGAIELTDSTMPTISIESTTAVPTTPSGASSPPITTPKLGRLKALANLNTALPSSDPVADAAFLQQVAVLESVFDEPLAAVIALMQVNSFSRFQASKIFTTFVTELKQGNGIEAAVERVQQITSPNGVANNSVDRNSGSGGGGSGGSRGGGSGGRSGERAGGGSLMVGSTVVTGGSTGSSGNVSRNPSVIVNIRRDFD